MIKVTVIMPCYNGEKYISRCFESLLKQTFKDFEVIFVDDGSTDNTKQVVLEYKDKFNTRNIPFYYIYKENGGAASALNVAFKQTLHGEYLLIMDADDALPPNSLKARFQILNKFKKYDAVVGKYRIIQDSTNKTLGLISPHWVTNSKQKTFYNIIATNKLNYVVGLMFRKDKFIQIMPSDGIYESKFGQNLQLLMPFAYKYKIKKSSKILYDYYVRADSHSHIFENQIDKEILYRKEWLNTKIQVLKSMGIYNKENVKLATCGFIYSVLYVAFKHNKLDVYDRFYKQLKHLTSISLKEKIKNKILHIPLLYKIYRKIK